MKIHNLVTILSFVGFASASKREVLIGAIFHGDDDISQIAFKQAVDRINYYSERFQLTPSIFNISRTDSYKAQKIACQLASEGVDAIFGPGSLETSGVVASICEKFEIPHIMYHWKTKPMSQKAAEHMMTLNLYPNSNSLARAFAAVLMDYDWNTYTIVYENKENLIRLKDILQIHGPESKAISVRQLGDDCSSLLKEIYSRGEVHIILDISTDKIVPFLQTAIDVKMLSDYNNYFITNLDTHTLDFGDLINTQANITSLRLVDPNSNELENAMRTWKQREQDFNLQPRQIPHEAGLVHDAVQMFMNAFKKLATDGRKVHRVRHNCTEPKRTKNQMGFDIAKFLKTQEYEGITGMVQFNEDEIGRISRKEFRLQILELSKQEFRKIGSWESTLGVKYDREAEDPDTQLQEAIESKVFKIVVKIGEPFLIERKQGEDEVPLEGNARYDGYVVDLINRIQQVLKFKKYELEVVPDGQYGTLDPSTKKWNGLVKHLLDRKADLAIADLTMTYERKTAVDFTSPFMSLGIGILYKLPDKKPANLFSFLDPFTVDVWLYTALAYLGVSVMVFILSRINEDDWEASHPCNQEPDELESIWNILNCIWLSMGSIMGQGCDILPKGSSTRIVSGLWWFFALIMLASYTANLAAFLTMDRMNPMIRGAEDLAKQTKIKYGAVKGGSTLRFFQESNFSTYQRMWAAMETNGDIVHTTSNPDGKNRVLKENGNYAFLMESVPMEFITNKDCNLTQVGALLDSKGYGIALPLNSPYRKAFNEAILNLSEKGVLNVIKDKWWKTNLTCEDNKAQEDLGIDNVGGVFVVLVGGCLVALVIAFLEFLWNVEKIAIEEKISPWDAFKSELSFAFNIWVVTKPVRSKSSEIVSRKSTPPRSLKCRSRYGSETRSLKNKSTRSLNFDEGIQASSRSLLNLN